MTRQAVAPTSWATTPPGRGSRRRLLGAVAGGALGTMLLPSSTGCRCSGGSATDAGAASTTAAPSDWPASPGFPAPPLPLPR
jgi:hypothetical protein